MLKYSKEADEVKSRGHRSYSSANTKANTVCNNDGSTNQYWTDMD